MTVARIDTYCNSHFALCAETEVSQLYTPEINKALAELKKLTGTSFEVNYDTTEELDHVLSQLKNLISAYKEKYNKTDFLLNLITGETPDYNLIERAKLFHIDTNVSRILYLIDFKSGVNGTIIEILSNLMDSREKAHVIQINHNQLVLLKPVKPKDSSSSVQTFCNMIVDTLNMEALVSVHISFSKTITSLSELGSAHRETALALKVGKLFNSEERVYPYNKLGVGRLIYQLPLHVCESFIQEVFGDKLPDIFDNETNRIINKFIVNNLNIAETSRQLHMHRNTLIFRLEKIQNATGLDLRNFEDALTFRVATMVIQCYKTQEVN